MITNFLLAFQFLTVIPLKIKKVSEQKIADSVIYFPLIGAVMGLSLAGLNQLLFHLNFPNLALSAILIVSLIIITGGMHLDGLSDTADAFLSVRPQEEMLKIMRDSHVGVMGALSLISAIVLKIALFYSISNSLKPGALVLMCSLSRWSVAPQMFFFPYARKEGKAAIFITGMSPKIFISSTLIAAACAFLVLGLKGLTVLLGVGFFAYFFGKLASSKINGITGDTLGATIELTEIVILSALCIMGGMIYG